MSRTMEFEHDSESGNSFLDVITASIGILIILVLVTGQHARQLAEALVVESQENSTVAAARAKEAGVDQQARELAAQMTRVQAELAEQHARRGQLSTLVAAIEHDLDMHRQTLDSKSRARFDADRETALAREELAQLDAERKAAEQVKKPKIVKVENYPTPIGRTVESDEIHFQLINGRVAWIPYLPLITRLKNSLRDYAMQLHDQPELVDTIGPIEGFRLRFVIQRHDVAEGSLVQLAYAEFIPNSAALGETVDEAFESGSKFRDAMSTLSPDRYTITIWTYPDSFPEFAKLKRELYRLGYQVAARPLPEGMPIGASPQGSKSSAE